MTSPPHSQPDITDAELAAWARRWHWNDTADEGPVDFSIYFRDRRMLRAFIEFMATRAPAQSGVQTQPEGATPGPWTISEARTVEGEYMVVGGAGHGFGLIASCPSKADAELIVGAASRIEYLERTIETLEANAAVQAKLLADTARSGVQSEAPDTYRETVRRVAAARERRLAELREALEKIVELAGPSGKTAAHQWGQAFAIASAALSSAEGK